MRVLKGLSVFGLGLFAAACSGEVGDDSSGVGPSSTVPETVPPGTPGIDPVTGMPVATPVDPVTGMPVATPVDPVTGMPVATPVDPVTGMPVTPPVDPTDPVVPPNPSCNSTPIEQGLVLLSDIQFANSIASVMGPEALTAENLPVEERKPFSRKVIALNTSLVLNRMDWAEDAGNSIVGRVEEVTGCSDGDQACAQTYLEGVARAAFRRPISAEESTELMNVFTVGAESNFETGMRLSIEAILSSPSFFYRTEFGQPAADGSIVLTPLEIASELSYLLTDGPPDEALIAAGENGSLADTATIVAQAERLLADEATQKNLTSTMMAAWSFGNLADVVKDDEMFPEFGGLRAAMYEETKLFLQDILWTRNADVSEILSSPTTFVNEALAELYGVQFPGGDPQQFVEVTLPAGERAGMLTQASVMSARSRTDRTSVVSRGIFVRGDLMCLPKIAFPDGDPALNELIAAQDEDTSKSEKEKADDRAVTSPCNTCHSQFDAFGVPLEYYDPIGRYTPQDVDTSVDLAVVAGLQAGSPSASTGVELAQALAAAPQFKSCMTRHMLSYGLGSDELLANSCEVQAAVAQLPTTTTMTDIIRAVASSPALITRTPGAAQ